MNINMANNSTVCSWKYLFAIQESFIMINKSKMELIFIKYSVDVLNNTVIWSMEDGPKVLFWSFGGSMMDNKIQYALIQGLGKDTAFIMTSNTKNIFYWPEFIYLSERIHTCKISQENNIEFKLLVQFIYYL